MPKKMTVTEAIFHVARWWGPDGAPTSLLKQLNLLNVPALKQILLDEKQDGEDKDWPQTREFQQAAKIILEELC